MKFINIINEDYESSLLQTTGLKPIVDAIQNRRPITFMYTGPVKGKEKVKRGTRQNVEPVALGLTKKNRLAIRAWVPSANPTLTGLEQNQWRTFLLSRMNNIRIDLDTNYQGPKNGFNSNEKEGNPLWPLIKIYAATDFSTQPKKPRKAVKPTPKPVKQPTEPKIEPKVPEKEPEVEPTTATEPTPIEPKLTQPTAKPTELPQPKPETKPTQEPPTKDDLETEPENPEEEKDQLSESIKRMKNLMFY